jgi:heptosyltransferase-1
LGVPAVTLYGATDVRKTGATGTRQKNIVGIAQCAPCMQHDCRNLDERNEPICWKNVGPERVSVKIGVADYKLF